MHEHIGHILSSNEIHKVPQSLSAIECAKLMANLHIGALIVTNEQDNKIIGLISERDITRFLAISSGNIMAIQAKDIVFEDVAYLDINDPIEKAMHIINKMRRRHVLINENGKLIGILSIGDIMKHIIEDKEQTITHLENYIRG